LEPICFPRQKFHYPLEDPIGDTNLTLIFLSMLRKCLFSSSTPIFKDVFFFRRYHPSFFEPPLRIMKSSQLIFGLSCLFRRFPPTISKTVLSTSRATSELPQTTNSTELFRTFDFPTRLRPSLPQPLCIKFEKFLSFF